MTRRFRYRGQHRSGRTLWPWSSLPLLTQADIAWVRKITQEPQPLPGPAPILAVPAPPGVSSTPPPPPPQWRDTVLDEKFERFTRVYDEQDAARTVLLDVPGFRGVDL